MSRLSRSSDGPGRPFFGACLSKTTMGWPLPSKPICCEAAMPVMEWSPVTIIVFRRALPMTTQMADTPRVRGPKCTLNTHNMKVMLRERRTWKSSLVVKRCSPERSSWAGGSCSCITIYNCHRLCDTLILKRYGVQHAVAMRQTLTWIASCNNINNEKRAQGLLSHLGFCGHASSNGASPKHAGWESKDSLLLLIALWWLKAH